MREGGRFENRFISRVARVVRPSSSTRHRPHPLERLPISDRVPARPRTIERRARNLELRLIERTLPEPAAIHTLTAPETMRERDSELGRIRSLAIPFELFDPCAQ